ncbi:hypothetical protein DL93DRAFT_2095579 [Clavulina sp. PMI_390]|nr:hypothetical protein DL93DRAFT_2095579 [Clavulina sp. PMI_390]
MPWVDDDRALISQAIDLLQKQKNLIQRAQWRKTARQMRKRNEHQPIFRLPKELLISIVELGAPMIGDAWSEWATPCSLDQKSGWRQWSIQEYEEFRRSLGLTCSAFFSLIMQSPRCWNYIPLTITRPLSSIQSEAMELSKLKALENSLKRSSPVPFDLFIIIEVLDTLSLWDTFRDILSPHLHRCRGILMASAYPAYGLFEQLFAGAELDALKHLILSWGNWSEPGYFARPNPFDVSLVHPVLPLESLSLCDGLHVMPFDFLQSLLNSSTSNTLRRLRLVGANPPETVLPFLQYFESLEHLAWQLCSPHTDIEYPATPIRLPRLVTLNVHGFEGFRSFPPIIAPRLEQVMFRGEDHYDPPYPTTAKSHLFTYKDYPPASIFHPNQISLPSLRRLCFNPRFHRLDYIIQFLTSHTLLTDVMIDNDTVVSMLDQDVKGLNLVIDTLARSPSPDAFATANLELPLISLHLNFVHMSLGTGSIKRLLTSLKRLVERVPRIEIHYMAREGVDIAPSWLPQLRRCGTQQYHCTWPDAWSQWERIGDNLRQNDDDVESVSWVDYIDPSVSDD